MASSGGFVLDTPEQIDFYRLCVLRGMLRLQAAGMKPRSVGGLTPLKAAQRDYGVTARTAKAAADQLDELIDFIHFMHENGG